jgi:signal transduction histidine kinase
MPNSESAKSLQDDKEIKRQLKDTVKLLRATEKRLQKLLEQQAEMTEVNAAKDEFISLASHQLRTPATGVKQFIGMLLENYFGELSEDQRTMLEYAYESNERQLEVINDLLRVAQVDAGKVMLTKQKSDLADMLEDIMQEQRTQFTRRKQKVVLDRPTEPVYAKIDPSRIRMVVENLIDNASKYTPEGKGIKVIITQDSRRKLVNISVKDEGVGIAKEDIPKLFQKFSRVDNPLSIQVGGTGIGLYWAKKIMDLHGGSITLKSKQGKGTTFTVKIPA